MNNTDSMIIYYDNKGDIKAITPDNDVNFSEYKSISVPFGDVKDFLTTEKSVINYYIKQNKKEKNIVYSIELKKSITSSLKRTLDTYLTKVGSISTNDSIIIITNNTKEQKLYFELNSSLDNSVFSKEEIIELFKQEIVTFYLTKRNNPYYLLNQYTFPIFDLIKNKKINFSYTQDYKNTSIYTKKDKELYTFIEKD